MAYGAIEVSGLRDLSRTFQELSPALERAWRDELLKTAEPVKKRAEQLAGTEIRNILSETAEVDWWRMRIGVDRAHGIVYVAPNERGIKQGAGKRPNLAPLLMNRAMQPALDESAPEIYRRVESMLDRVITQLT
jgi:hypothetical protein